MSELVDEETVEAAWQRLDARTLITRPVASALRTLVGIAVAVFGIGRATGFSHSLVIGAAFVVLPGVLEWATTTYRLTGTHLELRRGLLSRSTLTTRLDRIRTVEVESAPVHRLLGVTRLVIGTGSEEEGLELDAVSVVVAERLRRVLLHRTDAILTPAPSTELARGRWAWALFAPLNVGNLVVAVATMGALLGRLYDEITPREVRRAWHWFGGEHLSALLLEAVLVALAAWVLLSIAAYAIRWYGLVLTREHGPTGSTLRLVHGALTRRATSLEEAKVRGIVIRRRTLVGLAGGAELDVLTTGLGEERERLLPSAPAAVVRATAVEVIGAYDAIHAPVLAHGPAAHRRCHWRAQRTALRVPIAVAVLVAGADLLFHRDVPWWWVLAAWMVAAVLAVPVGELRYHRLGHALTERHLVSTTGGVTATRTALETDGIIGWRLHRSFWDRRVGLAQLVATTAAGPERVTVRNLPFGEAVALAADATPAMLAEFLEA